MINRRRDGTYVIGNTSFLTLSAAEHSQWLTEQLRPQFHVVLPSNFRIPCKSRLEAIRVQAERGGEIVG